MKYSDNIYKISLLNPDFMGFIFYSKSNRFIGKNLIIPYLKKIKKVGVFVNASRDEIYNNFIKQNLDFIQLHGNEDVNYCESLYDKGIKIIKVFSIHKNFNFDITNNYLHCSNYFLFDTKTETYGGSGKKFPWNKLYEYSLNMPFFLSGGLCPSDAESILKISHPLLFGVDFNSNFEIDVGKKSFKSLNIIIKKLR